MNAFNELLIFLQNIDEDFTPCLSDKVVLSDYVAKIMEKADLIIERGEGDIRGLVVLYCNDEINRKAYISLVGVSTLYRNQGIAKRLMKQAIQIVKKKKFRTLGIHSNNPVAIRLYQSLGFSILISGERSYLELRIS